MGAHGSYRPLQSALRRTTLAGTFSIVVLLCTPAATLPGPRPDSVTTATLSLSLGGVTFSAGRTLTAGVTVENTGGGPLADFYFVILLPDGATVVSAGPGIGARFGRFADLRTLVPVASAVSLASPFDYQNDAFFSYTFTGGEPTGTYRVYFAALAAGALRDGVIGGAELLALATAEFRVSPRIATAIDPSRTVTAVIEPEGGEVATSSAEGVDYALTLPEGAVPFATAISVTPIVSAANLPGGGTFALGLRGEPSGLSFGSPATLTVTLPVGMTPSAEGYAALLSSGQGRLVQVAPVLVEDRVLTVTVPHFTDVIVMPSIFQYCAEPATAEMGTACELLVNAFEAFGSLDSNGFRVFARDALEAWFLTGLRGRLAVLVDNAAPPGTDLDTLLDAVYGEWFAWVAFYEVVFGPLLVTGDARPFAALIDDAASGLAFGTRFGQRRANERCLADKGRVAEYVDRVQVLTASWVVSFDEPPIFPPEFCLDLHIEAAPPPVLTPGTPSDMPVSIVARFTDGVELPGPSAVVAITATNANVSPAGGVVTLPLNQAVSITPAGTSSTIVITAQAVSPLQALPLRRREYAAGRTGGVTQSTSLRVRDSLGETPYDDQGTGVVAGRVERQRTGPLSDGQPAWVVVSGRSVSGPLLAAVTDAGVLTNVLETAQTLAATSRVRVVVIEPGRYNVFGEATVETRVGAHSTPSATFRLVRETGSGPVVVLERSVEAQPNGDSDHTLFAEELTLEPGTYLIESVAAADASASTDSSSATVELRVTFFNPSS